MSKPDENFQNQMVGMVAILVAAVLFLAGLLDKSGGGFMVMFLGFMPLVWGLGKMFGWRSWTKLWVAEYSTWRIVGTVVLVLLCIGLAIVLSMVQ